MKRSRQILPVIQKGLLVVRNSKEMTLEYLLRDDGHLDRLEFLKIVIDRYDFIIKYCKIWITTPYKIGAASWNNGFEWGSFDNTKFLAVAECKMMAIGTVPKIGGVYFSCA